MKKKILFVTADSSLYGANLSLMNIISSISNEVDTIHVVTPYFGEFNIILNQNGIKNTIIPFNTSAAFLERSILGYLIFILKYIKYLFKNVLAKSRLKRLVKENKFTIIHSNSSVVDIGEEVAKSLKLPHVWHVREFIDLDHKLTPFIGKSNYKKKLSRNSTIIFISKAIKEHFNLTNVNSELIYDAVFRENKISNIELENDTKSVEPYFLFCGSLTQNKGIETALRAFYEFLMRINSNNNNFKLYIAGSQSSDSSYKSHLDNIISELHLLDKVKFLGYVNSIYPIMKSAEALLMCSQNEALGRVTIESMLNKCIVLGYSNAGTLELLNEGKYGYLFENIDDLANLMVMKAKGELEFDKITENAKIFVLNEFSEKSFKEKLMLLYSKIS